MEVRFLKIRAKLFFILKNPFWALKQLLVQYLPFFRFIRDTSHYQCYIDFDFWFNQKVLNRGGNRDVYWPVHPTSKVVGSSRIIVGVDAYPGIMGGCYIQGIGGVEIGDYTQVASNVIIVSANHDVYDSRNHISAKVTIGKYCWLGGGSKIMPGVTLGDFTIVGAGAVVTSSFPEGHCIIAGVPAKKIKVLEIDKCIRYELHPKYNGYISARNFDFYRKKHLLV
jgi:acetyltransferase-like isoleucine patch superfamily enzyme